MDGSASRWHGLLCDLQKELERMNAKLRILELENLRLRETVEARPRLELSRSLLSPAMSTSLSTSPGFKSEGSQADQSWSVALSSTKLKKPVVYPNSGVSSRWDVDQNGSGQHVELAPSGVNTFMSADTVLSDEKVPTKSILKKESRYRVASSPESSHLGGCSSSVGLRSKAVPVHGKSSASQPPKISGVSTRTTLLMEDNTKFAILRAGKTKVFAMQKPWYIINPDSNLVATIWQIITSVGLLWIAIATPLQVGLVTLEINWVFVTSLVVDFVFLIDMTLQFFTSYVRRTPRGEQWEVRTKQIVLHYLSTWFLLDFITLIPFELVAILGGSAAEELTMIKVIRVLRLLKLTRLARGSRFAQRLEAPISLPYQHLALLRCVFVLIILCHWMASLWASTILLVPDGAPTWIDGIAAMDEDLGIETRVHPVRIYIASFYFCSYTMTSVGYGDIGPQNIVERVVCTMIVLGAGLSWACVLGEVCAIVAEMNSAKQAFRQKMHHLNRMMGEQGLPSELRRRLRTFFLQNRNQCNFVTHQHLLQDMSAQLQAEVCTAVNLPWLRKVPFFNNFLLHIEAVDAAGLDALSLHACIADVAKELDMKAYAQRESFSDVQVLHILAKGLLVLNTRVATNGAVWGEDFVLADVPLIQRFSGFALTYVEVLCLKRESFMDVIERRRADCPELGQIVRRYCVRIAVFRGILAEARRLKLLQIQKEDQRTPPTPPQISVPLPPEISVQQPPAPGMVVGPDN